MREPWFYCPDLRAGSLTLADAESRHALQSLRLQPGDPVVLFDGRGRLARATAGGGAAVAARGAADAAAPRRPRPAVRRGLAFTVATVEEVPPPDRTLTLIVAACKGPRLEWLVEKCTELGVTRLLFTEFERSVVQPGEQRLERLQRHALEACKQCHRLYLPLIEGGLSLTEALAGAGDAPLLVAHLAADATPLGPCLLRHAAAPQLIAVIGPEGGLTPAEVDRMVTAGGEPVALGAHILRVETAAMGVAAGWAAAGPACA
jgi:16S rRNA (uracil1498-N3)-methyltransferase